MSASNVKIAAGYSQVNELSNAVSNQHQDYYHTITYQLEQLGITPTPLTIDPLATDWFSEQQPNHFRSGCAPIMALAKAKQLIEQGHQAVVIQGDDSLLSGYERNERHRLMSIYGEQLSILDLYDKVAQQFISKQHYNEQQFKQYSALLFENYAHTHQQQYHKQRAYFEAPALKWFRHVSPLFRGVDCANPLVDFKGRLLLCSDALCQRLNLATAQTVTVAGVGLGELNVTDETQAINQIADYAHLTHAYQQASSQANFNFSKQFMTGNGLMEAYTCYPVVPMALLQATGLIRNLNQLPGFLSEHSVTITGGMNLARAPWNNPALNGLIEMYQQLTDSQCEYGLVHGNGGLGYRQGIALLTTT
ncbi:hypothetical protein [Psychrobium sp. 1_MG-2023]|uniref:hypothetical protein n=1 Tax=Psychrobium sp. 1_MG-2023 TaxID=3062624 RepID=UPI000C34995C|nr:hypothetical protein [Psychrobium sp. 1_MG-2023]MDP2561076.1 hypothetical protein [Psychrobium sp. 1_MG-2023]PKF58366.1 hypothetical protein CW748_04180 [Alteromonadales bacterium alter-6D02]